MIAMTASIEQWESDIAELWERFDSLERSEGVPQTRELVEACPPCASRGSIWLYPAQPWQVAINAAQRWPQR